MVCLLSGFQSLAEASLSALGALILHLALSSLNVMENSLVKILECVFTVGEDEQR